MPVNGAGIIVYRQGAGAGPLATRPPEFLLLRGRWNRHWSIPKGHLNRGEGVLPCALRETEEETGLAQEDLVLEGGFEETVTYRLPRPTRNVPSGVKSVRVFLARASPSARVALSREHTKYRWARAPLAEVLLPREFAHCVRAAADRITAQKSYV